MSSPAYADARVLAVRNIADELSELDETPADVAAREEGARVAQLLREAHELIEAGNRWADFRRNA